MNPNLSCDVHFESKGFMEAVNVTDFPIRDHKVILVIRRRRWTDMRTGKSFSLPISLDIACKGTRYSKEFGAFLKETYGDIPPSCRRRKLGGGCFRHEIRGRDTGAETG